MGQKDGYNAEYKSDRFIRQWSDYQSKIVHHSESYNKCGSANIPKIYRIEKYRRKHLCITEMWKTPWKRTLSKEKTEENTQCIHNHNYKVRHGKSKIKIQKMIRKISKDIMTWTLGTTGDKCYLQQIIGKTFMYTMVRYMQMKVNRAD
jgi:hypothetical protein